MLYATMRLGKFDRYELNGACMHVPQLEVTKNTGAVLHTSVEQVIQP